MFPNIGLQILLAFILILVVPSSILFVFHRVDIFGRLRKEMKGVVYAFTFALLAAITFIVIRQYHITPATIFGLACGTFLIVSAAVFLTRKKS